MASTISRRLAGSLFATASAGLATYWLVARPWMRGWGTRGNEAESSLPGDDLVPEPKLNCTHAVTIDAPVSQVWPWLVQMGQGRGGFYSYTWIENLMRLDIHNADRILPEFQDLKVGDRIALAAGVPGIPVALLDPYHALVLHADTRLDDVGMPMKEGEYLNLNWGFYLDDAGDGRSRLIERWRVDWNPSLKNELIMRAFMEPGAFLMERKMLLGIKERAEKPHRGKM